MPVLAVVVDPADGVMRDVHGQGVEETLSYRVIFLQLSSLLYRPFILFLFVS